MKSHSSGPPISTGGPHRVLALLAGLLLILLVTRVHATSPVYVSQSGAGAQTGADAADAFSIATVTTSGNCASDVPAGTTLRLTGNFTYAAGVNGAIVLACSGAMGNPVTITTDPSTRPVMITSPGASYGRGSSPCCLFDIGTVNYVTVDGGVPCGTVQNSTGVADSPNSCALVIEDTAEGTAYDAINVGGMIDGSAILGIGGGAGIEIKNLAAINSYVHLPPWQITSVSVSGTTYTVTCSAACPVGNGKFIRLIGNSLVTESTLLTTTANNSGGSSFTASGTSSSGTGTGGWAIDVWGDGNGEVQSNFYANSVLGCAPGALIHDSVFAHGGWLVFCNQSPATAMQYYNNQIYDFDHGFAMGVCSNGGCVDNNTYPGPILYLNHFSNAFNWDDYFDPLNRNTCTPGTCQGTNNNHHDPIHLEVDLSHTTQRSFTAPQIYSNRFDGDFGVDMNAVMFLRASSTNEAVFNNLIQCSPARGLPTGIFGLADGNGGASPVSFTTNPLLANNSGLCTGNYTGSGPAVGMTGNSTTLGEFGAQWLNNIFGTVHFDVDVLNTTSWWGFAAGGGDYNFYQDGHTDSAGVAVNFVSNTFGFFSETLAGWRTFLAGCTTGSTGCAPMGTGSPWAVTQGQDAHSQLGTFASMSLAPNGQPMSGSPLIRAGLNLTSLCGTLPALCTDIAGVPRPATGPWDIGAFQLAQTQLGPLNSSLSSTH